MARGSRAAGAGPTDLKRAARGQAVARGGARSPDIGRVPAGPGGTAADLPLGRSTIEQLVAQQATLAHIGQRALTERSLIVLFADACALVSQVLDTELVALLQLTPDGRELRLIEGVGWRPGVVGELLIGHVGDTQSGYTIATGGPVIVPDLHAETRFKIWPAVRDHGAMAGMSVRVGDAQTPFGALSAYTTRLGRFTRDDANFLQAVANVIGAAVERERIESALRSSRDQLAAIVGSIDEGITVLTPNGLLFANEAAARLSGFESAAEMTATPTREILNRYEMFDEDGQPLTGEQLPSRRALAGEDRPEMVIGFRIKTTGEEHWSSVRGSAVRDADGRVTHVISTFRDITEERWSNKVRQFMVDAVAALSGTLDMTEAARRLADLCVPQLADYCTVDMLEPDGSVSPVALAHSDPVRLKAALRARELQPVVADAPAGPGRVIREGTPEMSEITLEMIEAAGLPEEELKLLRELELRWYLCVPLIGRHGPIGALSLVMAQSGRRLGEREMGLATELGLRAGIALENAQLYKAANDRRAQLDTVLAALAEAVIVFDGSGRLRLGNRTAAHVFEGRLPATLDELWRRLTPVPGGAAPERSGAEEGVEVAADGGSRWFELRRYGATADGVAGGAETGGAALSAPTVVVLRDVTQARAARAARDAFMGVLSHELRTPVTTIYGGSELLERGLSRGRAKEVISDIRIESERLTRLVEDLLVMTRVERGAVEIGAEPVLIQHLLARTIAGAAGRWGGARITLSVGDRLPAVSGDPTYIVQIVRNLLTNALRYGRGHERGLEVRASEEDGCVAVRVLDHGDGLGGEDPEKL
ncbi:MAG TPA: GAF domain-containing protein, partial [Candidatus Limnocylindrales bacterium]|nr:GAF domain-containing protein [Candidatus Limnocylindrales bacterium]